MTAFIWVYAISAILSMPLLVACWCDYYSRLSLDELILIVCVCLLPALNTALLLFFLLPYKSRL
jgi:hypothetical protein